MKYANKIEKICTFHFFVVPLWRENRNVMKETQNELREIINAGARRLTAEAKNRIAEIATSLGVELPTKERCGSCWIDTAVACYNKLEEDEQRAQVTRNDGRRYILKPNVDLLFGGKRINAATLTDELAEAIIARGFETKYFLKCE